MVRRLVLGALLTASAVFPADKTAERLLDLSRDIGNVHDQIDRLQKSLDEKMAALTQAQAGQLREAADQAAKSMSAVADRLQKNFKDQQDQQEKAAIAMAGLGTRLTEVSGDLGQMKEALSALTDTVNSLRTQVGDLKNAVTVMQQPAQAQTAPTISASDAFANANRDRIGGKLELAQQGYEGFLQMYPNDAQAHEAQYRIGWIQYSLKQYDAAIPSFDKVIEKYPESKWISASLFYKGKSLAELARWPEAMSAFGLLRKRFPTDPLAVQAAAIKPPAK
jgi:TolA-binding protein